MHVLAITNMYPNAEFPASGTFVATQLKGLQNIGVQVDVLFVERSRKGKSVYLEMGKSFRQSVACVRPDIVHVMYGGVMSAIVTHSVGSQPIVVSFCGSDLFGERFPSLKRRIEANAGIFASHIAAHRADGVIVKSQKLKDMLPADISPSKVRVIPNGVDLNTFYPMDSRICRNYLGWNPGGFHILFSIASYHSSERKRLVLARASAEALKRSVADTELHEMCGVAHSEVPFWINASDVVLLTSLSEGSPNIIKEALACDVPVVSVDVGDVVEWISEIDGCYVAFPSSEDITRKLALVHKERRRVSGRGHMSGISIEQVAHKVKYFYQDILNEGR
jgi:glycosyltransferase involved in cell wall biosynthesis